MRAHALRTQPARQQSECVSNETAGMWEIEGGGAQRRPPQVHAGLPLLATAALPVLTCRPSRWPPAPSSPTSRSRPPRCATRVRPGSSPRTSVRL